MKKLLLILLCLPMIGFGQGLDFYKEIVVAGSHKIFIKNAIELGWKETHWSHPPDLCYRNNNAFLNYYYNEHGKINDIIQNFYRDELGIPFQNFIKVSAFDNKYSKNIKDEILYHSTFDEVIEFNKYGKKYYLNRYNYFYDIYNKKNEKVGGGTMVIIIGSIPSSGVKDPEDIIIFY